MSESLKSMRKDVDCAKLPRELLTGDLGDAADAIDANLSNIRDKIIANDHLAWCSEDLGIKLCNSFLNLCHLSLDHFPDLVRVTTRRNSESKPWLLYHLLYSGDLLRCIDSSGVQELNERIIDMQPEALVWANGNGHTNSYLRAVMTNEPCHTPDSLKHYILDHYPHLCSASIVQRYLQGKSDRSFDEAIFWKMVDACPESIQCLRLTELSPTLLMTACDLQTAWSYHSFVKLYELNPKAAVEKDQNGMYPLQHINPWAGDDNKWRFVAYLADRHREILVPFPTQALQRGHRIPSRNGFLARLGVQSPVYGRTLPFLQFMSKYYPEGCPSGETASFFRDAFPLARAEYLVRARVAECRFLGTRTYLLQQRTSSELVASALGVMRQRLAMELPGLVRDVAPHERQLLRLISRYDRDELQNETL